jgi:hypothetical protein
MNELDIRTQDLKEGEMVRMLRPWPSGRTWRVEKIVDDMVVFQCEGGGRWVLARESRIRFRRVTLADL